MENRREVKPAKLPRFPEVAVCPACGKGGGGDHTVTSYVDTGMPSDSFRYIGCGYCRYDGPAPDHPMFQGYEKIRAERIEHLREICANFRRLGTPEETLAKIDKWIDKEEEKQKAIDK